MKNLTYRQRSILLFIQSFFKTNNCSPTYKEIADCFNIKINSVRMSVNYLIDKGFLSKNILKHSRILIILKEI